MKKLVLVVIDAMKPAMLERAVAGGRAPTLKLLLEEGQHVDDCVAAFPSVTPVCAASIATGTGPDEHEIPGMNWYHRGEGRYVEYGTSFRASQSFGLRQSLTDTIYNMNLEHLSRDVETVFERLDDADVRTAGTTYLMYRGRHRHEVSGDTALTRIASTVFRHAVYGPKELFYADMFASRRTPCRSQLGLPGIRDQHSGCVGEYLVENDLFDFLLLSLPDNDTHSHKNGPFAQVDSLAAADRQIAAAGRRRRRGRAVPRGPRGDRLLGPLAVARGRGDRPVPRLRRLRRAAGRARALRRRRDRACARTRAPPRSTCSTATAAPRSCRGSSARCWRSRASTSCCG